MTRDFNLIREILFKVENTPSGAPISILNLESDVDGAVVGEHLEIMIEAGLLDGEVNNKKPLSFIVRRLTWQGHDFINHARNDTIWKRVMAEAKQRGGSISLTVLDGLLTQAAKKYVGLK